MFNTIAICILDSSGCIFSFISFEQLTLEIYFEISSQFLTSRSEPLAAGRTMSFNEFALTPGEDSDALLKDDYSVEVFY